MARRIIGILWVMPFALLACIYPLIFMALGWYRWGGWAEIGVARFYTDDMPKRLAVWWLGWGGHVLPMGVVLHSREKHVERHELRHAHQWFALSILWVVFYLICLAVFGYKDNPLEVDARAHELEP